MTIPKAQRKRCASFQSPPPRLPPPISRQPGTDALVPAVVEPFVIDLTVDDAPQTLAPPASPVAVPAAPESEPEPKKPKKPRAPRKKTAIKTELEY